MTQTTQQGATKSKAWIWLTGIVVRSISSHRSTAAIQQAPSVTVQIEDLSRLKEQGLISDEEFNTKRAELLSRL